jgi:hypothetical protein
VVMHWLQAGEGVGFVGGSYDSWDSLDKGGPMPG